MSNKGFSHIGLSTHDLDATRDFYEKVLGFEVVRCDVIKIRQGGFIRHMFVDVGRDQLIAFMEPNDIPGLPTDFDAGINRGLGIPGIFYHFAFEAGSVDALNAKRAELIGKGVGVTDIVDHDWAMSIYFQRPQRDFVGVLLPDEGHRHRRRRNVPRTLGTVHSHQERRACVHAGR